MGYILRCRGGSYYVGSTRATMEERVSQHQAGLVDSYTARRSPVQLVFGQWFQRITDAIAVERQVKGWRREKKGAAIAGKWDLLPILSKSNWRPR